jgi:hypothetical protein
MSDTRSGPHEGGLPRPLSIASPRKAYSPWAPARCEAFHKLRYRDRCISGNVGFGRIPSWPLPMAFGCPAFYRARGEAEASGSLMTRPRSGDLLGFERCAASSAQCRHSRKEFQ